MADIQIYVATHKQTFVPEHPLLVPLQIGTAMHTPLPGFLHDSVGDNISAQNGCYCELTGQYWAWKNRKADYYGFYHYRRYFSFRPETYPYIIKNFPDGATLQHMGYQPEQMAEQITGYDMLVPVAETMYETVWDNYRRAPYHFIEDLQLMVQLVKELQPAYRQAAEQYLNGTKLYLKNMYIMKHDYFDAYCSWLFPLLEAFDRRNNWHKYKQNPDALRVDGYLAERLFGIWYTHLKQQGHSNSCELNRVHFARMDGGKGTLQAMKLINTALPPGTRRRSLASRSARFVLKKKADSLLNR